MQSLRLGLIVFLVNIIVNTQNRDEPLCMRNVVMALERYLALQILSPLHRVLENLKAVPILSGAYPRPLRVLGAPNMTLRVRHQAKNTP